MIQVRPAAERGGFDFGWLDTKHTFSFGEYYDPDWSGFSVLRVLNEDRVLPGQGFGMHGHRDMEILSWVLEGAIEHRDSLGNGEILRPGEIQRMSAGTGIRHSEFNPSEDSPLHFLQIWIQPSRPGNVPSYEQKAVDPARLDGVFGVVASPDGRDGSVRIQQDATLSIARLKAGRSAAVAMGEGRSGWVQVARGSAVTAGQNLSAGDGMAVRGEKTLEFVASTDAEILVFDLP
jgi:quercetin 2,3-dioxygenase